MTVNTPILLTKLSPGLVVKNYRELCRLTNQPELFGNSKKAQQKLFDTYFKSTRHGHKYIIESVYQEPLQTFRKVSKMTALQCYSLMYDLCQEFDDFGDTEQITTYRTQKQLHLLLGICSPDYYKNKLFLKNSSPCERAQYKRSILGDLPVQQVKDFYQEVDSRGNGYVSRLINNFIENYPKYLVSIKRTYNIEIHGAFRVCTPEEAITIFEAIASVRLSDKYLIINSDGSKDIPTDQQLYCTGQMASFYSEVLADNKLVELGITKIYYIWEFSYSKRLIELLDRYAEINKICPSSVLNTLNQKSVKYHDMRTMKSEAAMIANGKECMLPEDFLEDWLDTHYRPSRELLKTLIQLK